MMNRPILFLAVLTLGIPGLISCQKKGMLGGKEVQNFRTGLNRDNGKNGRSSILKNSVFVQPLANTPGDHEESQPTAEVITSAPTAQPSPEFGKDSGDKGGDKGAPGTSVPPGNTDPVPQNPGKSEPVPQNPGKTPPTGGYPPQTTPIPPKQPGGISMFPTRKVCSDNRVKYHGFALRNMNPEDLQFVFFPLEKNAGVKPFFVQGNASMVADIVNTGHVGMNLSSVPDGTYNLLLCHRNVSCAETKFLSEYNKLASFQKELYRDYANEYSREVAERTTKFTKKFEKNAGNHHRYRDGIMDDRRGIFGGAPRIAIHGGQIKFPTQSYLVKDNGIALQNVSSVQPVSPHEAYTAPQIVLLYDGNKRPVRPASSLVGNPVPVGKDPCPPGKDPCGGGYPPPLPPPPSGGDDCDDTVSPLIVDLDNTGLDLSAPLDGVLFDIDGDGLTDKISWPRGSGANFLALDLNGNGTIDNGTELFGNYTKAPDNIAADNGFLALAKYDDDKDGKITEKDAIYKKLLMWNDANLNGKSEANELKTLSQLGIKHFDLKYENGMEEDRYGNQTRERSVVSLMDGTLRMVFDIWFRKI